MSYSVSFICEPKNYHVDNCIGVGLLSCSVVHSKLLSKSVLFLIEAFKQDQGVSLKCIFYIEFLFLLSLL